MKQYHTDTGSSKENEKICSGLVAFNASAVSFRRGKAFIPVNRVIRDEEGEPVAGVLAEIYGWDCMSVEVLWVREDCRGKGMGSALLREAERIALEYGCGLVHLDTFDFQARAFYEKHGYRVFGVLEDCPAGHCRYYMKKRL